MLAVLVTGLPAAAQPRADGSRIRFGREFAKLTDPDRYDFTDLDGVEVPTLRTGGFTVKCLVYGDTKRVYVETMIRNRSGRTIELAKPFLTVRAGEQFLTSIDSLRSAEEIQSRSLVDFVPAPSGTDEKKKRPIHDPNLLDDQIKTHLARQEREENFAAFLLTLAHDPKRTTLPTSEERIEVFTFEAPPKKVPYQVMVRLGEEEFRFAFEPPARP